MHPKPSAPQFLRDLLNEGLHPESPRGLNASLRERLFVARRNALDEVPGSVKRKASTPMLPSNALLYPTRLSGAGDLRIHLPEAGFSWLGRARAFLSPGNPSSPEDSRWPRLLGLAVVLAVGLAIQFTAEDAEVRQSQREGDTDAQILTGELPLDAYADRGFAVFLRNMLISKPDLAADREADHEAQGVAEAEQEAPEEADQATPAAAPAADSASAPSTAPPPHLGAPR
jgi:hypothetical protein